MVFWFCGLSGSGKTTLANNSRKALLQSGFLCTVLDGDELRKGLNKNLGFSEEDRLENMRRTAEMAGILATAGVTTIVSLISPLQMGRDLAKEIIGADRFKEIYINCPLQVLKARDTKGMYKKAAEGNFKGLTGVDARFDTPQNPDLEIRTDTNTVDACTQKLLSFIKTQITVGNSSNSLLL